MSSLLSQTLINPKDSFYVLKGGSIFQGGVNITANGQVGGPTLNIGVSNAVGTIQMSDGANPTQLFLKASSEVDTFIGSKIVNYTSATNSVFDVPVSVEDAVSKNMFTISANQNDAYLTKCGIINYDPTPTPGGVVSQIKFGNNGTIQTTDKVQIGSSSVASVTVGPPTGDNVVVGPDRFAFQLNTTPTGGIFQQGSSIIIGQGSDPLNTGTGIIVSPSVIGIRKTIDAKNGNSITAQGSIVTYSSADNVGGIVQIVNGNYSLNLIAQGDGHAPSGVGGVIQSFNNGTSSTAPTKLIPGSGSYIVGDSSGNVTTSATGTITESASTVTLAGSSTANITSPTTTLTSSSAINLNAPSVYVNGTPLTQTAVWTYFVATNIDIYAQPLPINGSFVKWDGAAMIPPGTTDPMSPNGGPLPRCVWTVPYSGLYYIAMNTIGQLQNTSGSVNTSISFVLDSVAVGTPAVNKFGQAAGMVSTSAYIRMNAGQQLIVGGGPYGSGGYVTIYNQSSLLIQFISL